MADTKVVDGLITKYRPKDWGEVVGHGLALKALRGALEQGRAKTFLFTGGSGVGKTTLARIAAQAVGCAPSDVLEIDAATHTGIDAMREVSRYVTYRPLGGESKALIVDEMHALSKAAVQSLLKATEEPPAYAFWFFCTTEPARVLPTMRTRCFAVDLKPVPVRDLAALLDRVVKQEKLKTHPDILALCVEEAAGSPRQALSNLALCAEAKNEAEAAELLRSAEGSSEAVELARALVAGKGWRDLRKVLEGLKEASPESVRHVVRSYVTAVALNADGTRAADMLNVLDAFSQPFNPADGLSPLLLACGKVVFGGKD